MTAPTADAMVSILDALKVALTSAGATRYIRDYVDPLLAMAQAPQPTTEAPIVPGTEARLHEFGLLMRAVRVWADESATEPMLAVERGELAIRLDELLEWGDAHGVRVRIDIERHVDDSFAALYITTP